MGFIVNFDYIQYIQLFLSSVAFHIEASHTKLNNWFLYEMQHCAGMG